MTRFLALAILLLAGASAQAQYFYQPWAVYQGPNLGRVQYLGRVGNTPVFNPWNMYDNQNYSGYLYAAPVGLPQYISPIYAYNFGPYGTYYGVSGYNPGVIPVATGVRPGYGFNFNILHEPGRFVPLNASTSVNTITGTVLNPFQGVAYTNEGAFYRTGSLGARGVLNPANGTYVNPISGAIYNPATGVILNPN